MKRKQRWAGAICCSTLSIVVRLFLVTHMKGAFRVTGHPEIGLLFLVLPGAVASFFSQHREVLRPLFGAILAASCSMFIMRLLFPSMHSFWQELTWLLSAVLQYALRILCFLFIGSLLRLQHRESQQSLQRGGLSDNRASRFSFTHAAKSAWPPVCY